MTSRFRNVPPVRKGQWVRFGTGYAWVRVKRVWVEHLHIHHTWYFTYVKWNERWDHSRAWTDPWEVLNEVQECTPM